MLLNLYSNRFLLLLLYYFLYQCYNFNGGDKTNVIVISSISTNEHQY